MDKQKASWILEFILRQPIPDSLANAIFYALPIPALDPHLKKTLLLRQIGSDLAERSISERTLHSLELIEELDRTEGKEAPESLKAAYCAVAVECTSRSLRESPLSDPGNFFDAVKRIWNCRVADLEQSEAVGLVSDRLKFSRKEMEEKVVNPVARARILQWDAKREAMDTVREYLKETLKAMGPPFLERAAEAMIRKKKASGGGGRPSGVSGVTAAQCVTDGVSAVELGCPASDMNWERAAPVQGIEDVEKQSGVSGVPEERHAPDGASAVELDHLSIETNRERTSIETNRERTARVQGIDMCEGSTTARGVDASKHGGMCPNKYDILPASEVRKVKEALKSSCAGLQKVVEDPLPDAVAMAAGVLSSTGEKPMNPKELEHNQNQDDANVPSPIDKHAKATLTEGTITSNQCHKDREGMPGRSLMDRNPTAHTYEWDDDSIESPSESSPNSSKKVRLSNTRKMAVSPLEMHETTKFVRRRKFKRWSTLEEDTLREAVKRHGKGNWKFILSCHPGIFEERTEVDLKDKWRNMTRQ